MRVRKTTIGAICIALYLVAFLIWPVELSKAFVVGGWGYLAFLAFAIAVIIGWTFFMLAAYHSWPHAFGSAFMAIVIAAIIWRLLHLRTNAEFTSDSGFTIFFVVLLLAIPLAGAIARLCLNAVSARTPAP